MNVPTPTLCCKSPLAPKWRIRSGQDDAAPRYVGVCDTCHKETPFPIDDEAKRLLRYALVNDLLEVDPMVDNIEYRETKEEPEAIKAYRQMMQGQDDASIAMRIWFEFRYATKKAAMIGEVTWPDMEALIEASMKRIRKQIGSAETRDKVLGQFQMMLNRVREFIVHPDLDMAKICPLHSLPFFICPCAKD